MAAPQDNMISILLDQVYLMSTFVIIPAISQSYQLFLSHTSYFSVIPAISQSYQLFLNHTSYFSIIPAISQSSSCSLVLTRLIWSHSRLNPFVKWLVVTHLHHSTYEIVICNSTFPFQHECYTQIYGISYVTDIRALHDPRHYLLFKALMWIPIKILRFGFHSCTENSYSYLPV